MRKVIDDVIAERMRQIHDEGWSSAHDDAHDFGKLACAGAAYAINASDEIHSGESLKYPPSCWPPDWYPSWWKPKNPRRDLIRAAALIVAEIERLDRLTTETPNLIIPSEDA